MVNVCTRFACEVSTHIVSRNDSEKFALTGRVEGRHKSGKKHGDGNTSYNSHDENKLRPPYSGYEKGTLINHIVGCISKYLVNHSADDHDYHDNVAGDDLQILTFTMDNT